MKFDAKCADRRAFDRKSPRDLEISHGDDDAASLRLVEISLGGFSVMSTQGFAPGLTRSFLFTSAGMFTLTLRAMAIHSRRHVTADGRAAYTSGFAFVAATDELRDTIAMVVNGLADGAFAEWPSVGFLEHRI